VVQVSVSPRAAHGTPAPATFETKERYPASKKPGTAPPRLSGGVRWGTTPHASRPHNPDIANAFFRAGEIEAWGRGVAGIFRACLQADVPEPQSEPSYRPASR
jgi:hypothetical protein